MAILWRDVRYATRLLWSSPGFTAIALLALVLGIGANTAIFSVVNAVLLKPLPFRDANRLAMVWEKSPSTGAANVANPQNFADWQARNHSFEKMGAYIETPVSLTGDGTPVEVYGSYITRDFFPVLDVSPIRGHNFTPEEDRPGNDSFVVISEGLWKSRYGSDSKIVGRRITMSGYLSTIVGVIPSSFRFPEMKSEIWFLISITPGERKRGRYLQTVARLKPGVTLSQARTDMENIALQLQGEQPQYNRKWGAVVTDFREQFAGNLRTPLLVLMGSVGMVLLIACANVANLMLMRASGRQREMAIRSSLGATRWHITRQLLVESTMLGLAGGFLGLIFAIWARDALLAALPENMSVAKVNVVSIDGSVLAFTVVLSLLTGIIFGLVPALRVSRPDLSDTLKEGGRGVSGSLKKNRLRATLVAGEFAVAMMLLIGAGLLMKSFVRLANTPSGFQPERILSLRVNLTSTHYANDRQRADGLDEILNRIRRVPGVSAAGSISFPPLGGLLPATGFWLDGKPVPKTGDVPVTGVSIVTADYFPAMGVPLIQGRNFNQFDRPGSPQVTLINQALAREFFSSVDPVGQKVFVQWGRKTPYEIIGVVGDVKFDGLDQPSRPTVYFANAQEPNSGATIVIRTSGEPMALAKTTEDLIHSFDQDQAIAEIKPLEEFLTKSIARPRFQSVLLGIFAGLAVLLACIGIFGSISYSVAQRNHEIGVRIALGAQSGAVLRLVVGQGLTLALIGTVTGLAGALGLTRFLRSLLFEVSPTDPIIFVAVPALLCTIALAASFFPALRATQVDPMVALRYE